MLTEQTWLISLIAIYIIITVGFTLTFIRQIQLIKLHKSNGLQYYRRALTLIMGTYLLGSSYFLFALIMRLFGLNEMWDILIYGVVFIILNSFVAGSAWLYYAIYKGNDLKFLTFKFWKNKLR